MSSPTQAHPFLEHWAQPRPAQAKHIWPQHSAHGHERKHQHQRTLKKQSQKKKETQHTEKYQKNIIVINQKQNAPW